MHEFLNIPLIAFLKDKLLQNKDLDVLCKSRLSIVLPFYNVLSPFFFLLHSADALLTFASEQLASPTKIGSCWVRKGSINLLKKLKQLSVSLKIELSACTGMLETTVIHFNRKPMYKIECHFIVHDSSDS